MSDVVVHLTRDQAEGLADLLQWAHETDGILDPRDYEAWDALKEAQTRRHEDAVTQASETETRADERRHSAWMSPS